jgi:hypothetical protein
MTTLFTEDICFFFTTTDKFITQTKTTLTKFREAFFFKRLV